MQIERNDSLMTPPESTRRYYRERGIAMRRSLYMNPEFNQIIQTLRSGDCTPEQIIAAWERKDQLYREISDYFQKEKIIQQLELGTYNH